VVNKDAVGRTGPRFEVVIERGKIREFARATGSTSPGYLDDPEPVVPPTFLTTASFWQPPDEADLYRALDIDPRRLLHGEQEFLFTLEPPRAGTVLHAQTTVEEIYDKEGRRGGVMTFAVLRSDFTDDDGVIVAQARTILIETGRAPEGSPGGEG
jgi:N-terminal half of MaoC dehydratase